MFSLDPFFVARLKNFRDDSAPLIRNSFTFPTSPFFQYRLTRIVGVKQCAVQGDSQDRVRIFRREPGQILYLLLGQLAFGDIQYAAAGIYKLSDFIEA